MEPTPALKQLLEELTTLDVDDGVDVCLAPEDGSFADSTGAFVQVDPKFAQKVPMEVSEVNDLRLTCDTLAHEVEHIRSSDLEGKKNFTYYYPEAPKIAGMVYNILEDQYVDAERIRRKPGMARTRSFSVKCAMSDDEMMPPMSDLTRNEQFPAAFKELAFGGYVKEADDLYPEVERFLERIKPDLEEVRRVHDQNDRKDLYHRVTRTMLEHVERTECGPDEQPNRRRDRDEQDPNAGEQTQMSEDTVEEMTKWVDQSRIEDQFRDPEAEWNEGEPQAGVEFDTGPEGSGPADDESDDDGAGDDGDGSPMDGADADGSAQDAGEVPDGDGGDDAPGEAPADDESDETGGSRDGDDGSGQDPSETVERQAKPREEVDVDPKAATSDQKITDLGPSEIDEKYGTMDIDPTRETSLDRSRYERYVEKRDSFDTELETKRRERDERKRGRGDKLRSESRDYVKEVVDEFRDMVSRDQPEAAVEGQRLSRRNVVRRRAGDLSENRVYEKMDTTVTGDRTVAVAADISGSMRHDIWELKMMMGTLGAATEEVGDTFIATTLTDMPEYHMLAEKQGPDTITEEALDLGLVIGPDEDFDWGKIDSFVARNNEPTSAGMAFTSELVDMTTSTQDVMFVITDGRSHTTRDGRQVATDEALEDIKREKEKFEADGGVVIGIGLGSVGKSDMDKSFGEDGWIRSDIDHLAEHVIGLYKEQIDLE